MFSFPTIIAFANAHRSIRPVSVGVSSTQLPRLKTRELCQWSVMTPLTLHDTHLFSLLILFVRVSKFNVHDTPTEIGLTISRFHTGGRLISLVNGGMVL